ncbi:hypothetical protein D6779_11355 [Candidatus Parcubacteria bacterium]|nr:MAG: hypothetical protein D6779_11355 [Candidatus Parcubacteria bacterium]
MSVEIIEMPADEYHSLDRVSCSILKKMDCPAKARVFKEPSAAMDLGTAVHALVLEPDKDLIAVAPKINRRTKAGKEEWEAFQREADGKVILSQDDYNKACAMCDSVISHPVAADLFSEGKAEQSILWTDTETGEPCKARLDWLRNDRIVVDLKTARSASPGAFSRATFDLKYHWQCSWYSMAADADDFFFVVVESEAPYICEVYRLTDEAKEVGRSEVMAALEKYHACRIFDHWPGYSDEPKITMIDLPAWAYK